MRAGTSHAPHGCYEPLLQVCAVARQNRVGVVEDAHGGVVLQILQELRVQTRPRLLGEPPENPGVESLDVHHADLGEQVDDQVRGESVVPAFEQHLLPGGVGQHLPQHVALAERHGVLDEDPEVQVGEAVVAALAVRSAQSDTHHLLARHELLDVGKFGRAGCGERHRGAPWRSVRPVTARRSSSGSTASVKVVVPIPVGRT